MIANLISIIIGIVFIAFFAGFNLDNKCDVSLVFYTFKNIPVFFTILVSFAIGMLCSLPFALIHRNKKAKKIKEPKEKKVSAKNDSKNNSSEKNDKPESEQKEEAKTENSASSTGIN
ncbi:MAG: hypothetical protein UIB61_00715 [Treponema sp.]|jgi:uncharacterized integral membrane protein|nr:hypothetical protein [Treponema sp.]